MGLTVSKRAEIIIEAMIRTFYISMLGSNVRNEMCLLGSLNEMGHQLNIESSCQQSQTLSMSSTDSPTYSPTKQHHCTLVGEKGVSHEYMFCF